MTCGDDSMAAETLSQSRCEASVVINRWLPTWSNAAARCRSVLLVYTVAFQASLDVEGSWSGRARAILERLARVVDGMLEFTMTADRVGAGDEVPDLGWAGFWRIVLLVGLATLLFPSLVGGPRSVAAQERSVEWSRFDVTLDLQTDGSYHVTERQEVDFQGGPFSGGFRDVPLARIDDINNVTVSEETPTGVKPYTFDTAGTYDETPRTYTYRKTNSQLHIEWGFPRTVSEVRTFLVEYDVVGALRVYLNNEPPNEQIWWTAVGTELTSVAPVRESTMTMRLPIALPIDQTMTSDGEPAEHTKDGRVWTWTARDLTDGDSFETRLQFPPLIAANQAGRRPMTRGAKMRRSALRTAPFSTSSLLASASCSPSVVGSAPMDSGTRADATRIPARSPTLSRTRPTTFRRARPEHCSTSARTSATSSPPWSISASAVSSRSMSRPRKGSLASAVGLITR